MSMEFQFVDIAALQEQHRQWFERLSISDIERSWLASGNGTTLTEHMEHLAQWTL